MEAEIREDFKSVSVFKIRCQIAEIWLKISAREMPFLTPIFFDHTISVPPSNFYRRFNYRSGPIIWVLRVTLFLIFINDLPDCLDVQNALFADDLVLWITGTDTNRVQRRLNHNLANLTTYCEPWKLKINCRKTVIQYLHLALSSHMLH